MPNPKEEQMEKFWVSLLAVIFRDNKVLLLEHAQEPGTWMLPGGRVDIDEDEKIAFPRELQEELGITKFKILTIVGYHLWYSPNRHKPICSIIHLVDIGNANISISDEHAAFRWVSIKDIDQYYFRWKEVKTFIKSASKINKSYAK